MIFMASANVLSIDGKVKGSMQVPDVFGNEVRPDLIRRAVLAENTRRIQPQGHFVLAGMQTTARYYGKMNSYRSGRHMGHAIRPRQKLASGVQGQVRIVPSATKGKRAHPHLIEKTIIEEINEREYRKAIASAIAATAMKGEKSPMIVSDEIENISKTKQMLGIFKSLKLSARVEKSSSGRRIVKGLRRSSKVRKYPKSILVVVGKECNALKSARNMAGVDTCTVERITANLLAPGGVPGRATVWSESAVKAVESAIPKLKIVNS